MDTLGDYGFFKDLGNGILHDVGRGFSESIYHRAMEVELRLHGVGYQSEVVIPVRYKDYYIGFGRADIITGNSIIITKCGSDNCWCRNTKDYYEGNIIIELKSVSGAPKNIELTQLKTYLNSLDNTVYNKGIIINFGQPSNSQREEVDILAVNL
tara:strand:+ start:490 stop:951 length:462 start_codon:yes stop_codon:yes gene_type:complete